MHVKILLALVLALAPVTPAHANFFAGCQLILAAFQSRSAVAVRAVDKILAQADRIKALPYGEVWIGYVRNLSSINLRAPAEGNRAVPIVGEVKDVLTFMRTAVSRFQAELGDPALPNPRDLKPIQRELVEHIAAQLEAMAKGEQVQRADLLHVANLFAISATQQIYLHQNRTRDLTVFGTSAADIIRRNHRSEDRLDREFGMTALPLPTSGHLGFRGFLQLESTGVVPVGVTDKLEYVDGGTLEPARFFEHDLIHFLFRMRVPDPIQPVAIRLSPHAPLDMVLNVGLEKSLAFYELLDRRLNALATRRQQVLAEAVLFYFLHEDNESYGVIDFNAAQMRKRANYFLGEQRKKVEYGRTDFQRLADRLRARGDLGQAFKTPPTDAEVMETLRWIGRLR